MILYIDKETDDTFSFDEKEVAETVVGEALSYINCPYDVEIGLCITQNQGIREYNKDFRGIDKETDVLSFPNVDFETPGDFSHVEDKYEDYFNPDDGRLILGDMIISSQKVKQQALLYGHSEIREFAFLITHSMLHLFGFDHMEDEEREEMERHQKAILEALKIRRE